MQSDSVHTQNVLGVHIDNMVNWHVQIGHGHKTPNKKIALLKRIIYFLTPKMKTLSHNACKLLVFAYCCLILGIGSHRYINKIASLQKRNRKSIYSRNVGNSIPLEIRNVNNIIPFREKIKQFYGDLDV